MKIKCSIFLLCVVLSQISLSQTVLEANGPGDTYELINSVLAPGYDVVEEPDCNHASFGRHIDEVFDTALNKHVFRFYIHTSPDNDRCRSFDRQRNEIKTYDKSPDSLLGIKKERIEYRWKFKLDSAFQASSSFTHLHQLKAVGGPESSMPLITLTARKGTPDKLELRYAQALSQSTLYKTDLSPMKGTWIEARETVLYDEVGLGKYEIHLTKLAGGDTLFSYSNNSIRTWKTSASFVRPKWGIYRSLNDSTNLRDEQVLFADISIEELGNSVSISDFLEDEEGGQIFPNPVAHNLGYSAKILDNFESINIYDCYGKLVLSKKLESNTTSISHLLEGFYFVEFLSDKGRTRPKKIMIHRQ